MSVDVRNAKPANGAVAIELKSDPETKAVPRQISEDRGSAAQSWSWGRQHEPYDWMDAHTPFDDLRSWH
ncbi:hypothetical protein CR51_41040 [Caballeronia megalochromosomata]|jgi:hypothetical protein|nr:hypothetical protein CR51_41040 [Caballeronia megalochromosomata]